MAFLHFAVLAILQGVTEFLPLSSSAHLALIPDASGWQGTGVAFDLAISAGALAAVALYLVPDIAAMAAGLWRRLRGRADPGARLFGQLVAGTLPVTAAAAAVQYYSGLSLGGPLVVAWATLGFGILLYLGDRVGMTVRRIEHLQISDAVVVGIAQMAALIPGAGRAAVTMTAARVLGFERRDAARFSLILALPTLFGTVLLDAWQLHVGGEPMLTAEQGIVAGIAFLSALIAVAAMMAWLRRHSLTPFVIYRLLLGAALLAQVYGWY